MKEVTIKIEFCNNMCPHFYHNYDDCDNIWCGKLGRKVYVGEGGDDCWNDFKQRPLPKDCPLKDVE